MDRAGATSTGRAGATCRVGIGDGSGSARRTAVPWCAAAALAWVLRAGVVAREVTTALLEDLDRDAGRSRRGARLLE